jgi:pimeloyl-ACP methyl ester carboxylesterase
MLEIPINLLALALGGTYQLIACWRESQQSPPGRLIDVGGFSLHLMTTRLTTSLATDDQRQPGQSTIVLDHSLGGVEGYFLTEQLAPLGETLGQQFRQVCVYDRAGYGWSQPSPHRRTSDQIVSELDTLLTNAGIEPPYLLIGDSFGSYNMRLYADRFPAKVSGLILTDGLHEAGMLKMSWPLRGLQYFFISGFLMAFLGASFGIIRLLRALGLFELLKPELRNFSPTANAQAQRSFCRPKHWWTMTQELWHMDSSGKALQPASNLGTLPIVSIKAASFFLPSWWTKLMPLGQANQLRDRMHAALVKLSSQTIQLKADRSGHFVWIDQPEVMVEAIKWIGDRLR